MGLISSKECRICKFNTLRTTCCDYMLVTGTSKAKMRKDGKVPKCQAGKECAFYDSGERKKGRSQKPVPKDEDVIRVFRGNPRLTNAQIAKELGASIVTINAALARLGLVRESIFAIKDRYTGELLFEGTANQCATYVGYSAVAIYGSAKGKRQMSKYDCERVV